MLPTAKKRSADRLQGDQIDSKKFKKHSSLVN